MTTPTPPDTGNLAPPKEETGIFTIVIVTIFILGLLFFFIYWLTQPRKIKTMKVVKRKKFKPIPAAIEPATTTPTLEDIQKTTLRPVNSTITNTDLGDNTVVAPVFNANEFE